MNFSYISKMIGADSTLRLLGATVGNRARISSDIIVYNFGPEFCKNLTIGTNVFIGPGCLFDLSCPITIKDDVSISPQVGFITHLDVGNQPLSSQVPKLTGAIKIERGVWLGARALVLHGVTIGEFAMIGAMTLVNRDVQSCTLVVGVPFRNVRQYPRPSEVSALQSNYAK